MLGLSIGQSGFRLHPSANIDEMEGKAYSPGEMEALGRAAAEQLGPGAVVALIGGLGAGKTHWSKGFAAGLGVEREVTSPTFGLVHEYPYAGGVMFHLDFYRLESASEVLGLGWDECLDEVGAVVVEWADKFPEMMPPHTVWLEVLHLPDGGRQVRRMER